MGKLKEIFRLTRIEHSMLLIIAVIGGELLSGKIPDPLIFTLSIITPVFISMGAFAINDYFDIAVDKANKKDRPLVKKTLSPRTAVYITIVTMAIGILASAWINAICLAIAAIFAALSLLYSYRLKEILLVGNMYIALSMVIPFIYGSYVVAASAGISVLAVSLMVFLSGLAREIHGSIRDYKGDIKERGVASLPNAIGAKNSAVVAAVLYSVAIELSLYLMFALPPFESTALFAGPIIVSDVMLLYVSASFLNVARARPVFYDRMRNISLAAMGIALMAILFAGSVFYIRIPF